MVGLWVEWRIFHNHLHQKSQTLFWWNCGWGNGFVRNWAFCKFLLGWNTNAFSICKLGDFVVMPDHIHGIIIINKTDDARIVDTENFAHLQQPVASGEITNNKFGPQSKNLASIVRGYKIGVIKNGRLINPDLGWQSRYHDHIIRNETEYQRISNYIITNPENWGKNKTKLTKE